MFFQQLGSISDPFLISLVTTLVNVLSTPASFVLVEKIGRRPILIWGAAGMVIMQFIVGAIGATAGKNTTDHPANPAATRAMIAFICLNISVFATTWGPAAWIVIGEIFPLTIRSRGVGLSTSSNWLVLAQTMMECRYKLIASKVLELYYWSHHPLPCR